MRPRIQCAICHKEWSILTLSRW